MFTLTFVDLENENSISIWGFEKMNVLKKYFCFFLLVSRLNEKWNNLLMNSETLFCIWILAFPIVIILVLTPQKWSFLLYFSSLHDYWPPTTLISFVHISLSEMEWCEKRALQLLKMRKMKVSWKIITNCVTEFLTFRSSSMKDYTCHYLVSS